ncbi:hypothetical protein BMS3Bbin04_01144 [bacterium BMS3Bbin04]|nr:hypothetical protein BMS3Bbin04_01144 [bacterium BMS3Bbin04]
MKNTNDPILVLRARGPATEQGRIALDDLLTIGKHVQTAVKRIARVLTGADDSLKKGRTPKTIEESCTLHVVAMNKACFELVLDLPRNHLEAMDLGVESVEHLLAGMDALSANGHAMPTGFDTGVLQSLRDMGSVLEHDIEEIEFNSRTTHGAQRVKVNQRARERFTQKIREPISTELSIEGRLLMADFNSGKERCRIHRPMGDSVTCSFGENLEETVLTNLRKYVRATGEATYDPKSSKITHIVLADIEPLAVKGMVGEADAFDQFWQDKSLDELAAEQKVSPVKDVDNVFGAASDLWEDDADFDEFLSAARGIANREN